jgi:tetratricopeptide (TPR) repeat protein
VIAYNMLGYITMIQQRFVEAREYFVSYRYIAPDQANPHDSLGELYIVQGQWEDARLSFEHALEIKPDFWASYEHLVIVLSLMARYDEAHDVIDRLENLEGHPDNAARSMRCFVDMWDLTQRRADREILELADSGCVDKPYNGFSTIATHQAAVRLGERDRAIAIEQGIHDMLETKESKQEWMNLVEATLAHMQGVRLAAASRYDDAVERFREADDLLRFQETGPALLKLHNRLTQVETLLAAGRDVEGHRLLSEVRFINPVMVDEFEERGLRMVGIPRR